MNSGALNKRTVKVVASIVAIVFVLISAVVFVAGVGVFVTVSSAIVLTECSVQTLTILTNPINTISLGVDELKTAAARAYFSQFTPEVASKKEAIASLIVQIGAQRGFSQHSIAIAIATAIQESQLTNDTGGDRDSLGIYQQRPSQGWGTPAQIMDPTYAITKFYDRLATIPDRDSRPMIDVAIQIQIPNAADYHRDWKWDDIATEIAASSQDSNLQCTSSYTPVQGGWHLPLDPGYRVNDRFGPRIDPYTHKYEAVHTGIDLGDPGGTPIYAAHAGTVVHVGPNGDLGNFVHIDDGDGIGTGYGHMSRFAAGLTQGQTVTAGEIIGYVGSTGASTGNHLHFMVYQNGKPIDPGPFMTNLGLDLDASARNK